MRDLLLSLCLLTSLAGCAGRLPAPQAAPSVAEGGQARCELVLAVLREQAQREGRPLLSLEEQTQEPVQVFLREGDSPVLERFFSEEPECGAGRYRVVQGAENLALTLLLTPSGEGFAWEVHRGEGLVVPDKPQPMGRVLRGRTGWVVDVP
jgi:hypothetical protein